MPSNLWTAQARILISLIFAFRSYFIARFFPYTNFKFLIRGSLTNIFVYSDTVDKYDNRIL